MTSVLVAKVFALNGIQTNANCNNGTMVLYVGTLGMKELHTVYCTKLDASRYIGQPKRIVVSSHSSI